jgi:hypothetical protein
MCAEVDADGDCGSGNAVAGVRIDRGPRDESVDADERFPFACVLI